VAQFPSFSTVSAQSGLPAADVEKAIADPPRRAALNRSKGGQFIAHAKALPGNPYDGHTLATVIPEIETQIGANLTRIVADRGYRGHNAPPGHKFKVYISGQRRRVTETIKRELRGRTFHADDVRRLERGVVGGAGKRQRPVHEADCFSWVLCVCVLFRLAQPDRPTRPRQERC
jgi:hypothetical protein